MQATGFKRIEVDANMDRPGADLPGMPLVLRPRSTAKDCQRKCSSTPKCKTFAFDSCGKRNCWLKYDIPNPRSNRCRVSY